MYNIYIDIRFKDNEEKEIIQLVINSKDQILINSYSICAQNRPKEFVTASPTEFRKNPFNYDFAWLNCEPPLRYCHRRIL